MRYFLAATAFLLAETAIAETSGETTALTQSAPCKVVTLNVVSNNPEASPPTKGRIQVWLDGLRVVTNTAYTLATPIIICASTEPNLKVEFWSTSIDDAVVRVDFETTLAGDTNMIVTLD